MQSLKPIYEELIKNLPHFEPLHFTLTTYTLSIYLMATRMPEHYTILFNYLTIYSCHTELLSGDYCVVPDDHTLAPDWFNLHCMTRCKVCITACFGALGCQSVLPAMQSPSQPQR